MSEDTATNEAPQGAESGQSETPSIEALQSQIEELKAHSRKWEQRAKENLQAKNTLEEQRKASLSEEEKRAEALADAERRAKEAEEAAASAVRESLRFRIAAKYGVSDEDAELFLTGSDEETLTKQAERLSNHSPAPKPNPAQGNRSATPAATTTGQKFADALTGMFNN